MSSRKLGEHEDISAKYRGNQSIEVTEEDKLDYIERHLSVTDEFIEEAENLSQTEDREKWKNARRGRMSASVAGKAVGHMAPRYTPMMVVKDMLDPKPFSNEMMEYGNIVEPTIFCNTLIGVRQTLTEYGFRDVWFENTGTRISKEHPWLCASADALLYARGREVPDGSDDPTEIDGVCEFKGPWQQEYYHPIPDQYYDQFTCQAALHGRKFIVFSVYTPKGTQINYYEFDERYWREELFPALKSFYWDLYLPRAIWRERGILPKGQVNLVATIKEMRRRSKEEGEQERDVVKRKRRNSSQCGSVIVEVGEGESRQTVAKRRKAQEPVDTPVTVTVRRKRTK